MTAIQGTALTATVEARILTLWRQRQADRRLPYWTQGRHDREVELRALVALRRTARRLSQSEFIDHPADATWTTA